MPHDRDVNAARNILFAELKPVVRPDGSVTAGNASGINDGAAALLLASAAAVEKYSLQPRAKVLGFASAGVAPRVMGVGPIPAVNKLTARLNIKLFDFDVVELHEAFASQALACTRAFGFADDAEHVNPNGCAVALGSLCTGKHVCRGWPRRCTGAGARLAVAGK